MWGISELLMMLHKLTQIESVFKSLKSELCIRPIRHQREQVQNCLSRAQSRFWQTISYVDGEQAAKS
jgi:hypothetical protein